MKIVVTEQDSPEVIAQRIVTMRVIARRLKLGSWLALGVAFAAALLQLIELPGARQAFLTAAGAWALARAEHQHILGWLRGYNFRRGQERK